MDYAGRHMPSAEFDKESRELLSRLEEQEAKKLKLEKGEEAWAWAAWQVRKGFQRWDPPVYSAEFGLKPGLDCSQVRCPSVRRGLGILWHEKAFGGHQWHLGEAHPILGCLH